MPTSPTAAKLLDREFLDVRAKLIDLAASLDRIERTPGSVSGDPRIEKINQAAGILAAHSPDRTEKIQRLFSLPYDENWKSLK